MPIVMMPINALLTNRERCFVSALRKLLGDFDPECVIFQDMALLCYLQFAIDDINAHPTRSNFTFENWPQNWEALLLQGAQLQAMAAQSMFEQGKEFELNDNGVVINPPPVAAALRELHGTLLQNYEERKERIKADFRPAAGAGLGSSRYYGMGVTRLLQDRLKRFGNIY